MVTLRGYHKLRAVHITFAVCASVATALRVYVRAHLVKAFGWDDALMVVALLIFLGFVSVSIVGLHHGMDRHMNTLTHGEIATALRFWWICQLHYAIGIVAVKLSIGFFLLRFLQEKLHKWIVYIAMGLTVFIGVAFTFACIFECSPISFFWDKTQPHGSCAAIDLLISLAYAYSVISIVADFTLAILPIFLVWRMNISCRNKIALVPILGMACTASLAVVVRLAYLQELKNHDFLYATVDMAMWSHVEYGLAIIAGSLATLRPLVKRIAAKYGSSERSKLHALRIPYWNSHLANRKQHQSRISALFHPEWREVKQDSVVMKEKVDSQSTGQGDDIVDEPSRLGEKMENGDFKTPALRVQDEESQLRAFEKGHVNSKVESV